MIMKKIIHTIGFVDDNDDIVIIGSVRTEETEKIIRFTMGEEITAQLLESSILMGEADERKT